MPELQLLADFGQPLFSFAFASQKNYFQAV
jgi:hypothetical protein